MDEYERGKLHAAILIISILLILSIGVGVAIVAWVAMFYG